MRISKPELIAIGGTLLFVLVAVGVFLLLQSPEQGEERNTSIEIVEPIDAPDVSFSDDPYIRRLQSLVPIILDQVERNDEKIQASIALMRSILDEWQAARSGFPELPDISYYREGTQMIEEAMSGSGELMLEEGTNRMAELLRIEL